MAGTCLEAALGVFIRQAQNDAQNQVVGPSDELAEQRLALGLRLGKQPARTKRNVGALLDGGDELDGILDGRGEIDIAE